MRESEMAQIAEFVKRVMLDKEPVEKVRIEVAEFRRAYQKVHFCFENATEAYKYIKVR